MSVGDSVTTFETHRDRLFGLAYRMTGSVADAQDVCQESWLRWNSVDVSTVVNPEAFLVRTATRIAIDKANSATARHELYVGPHLPEPLVHDGPVDPQRAAELADSMTFAFLVLLDELKPLERAVFVLHDVFGYTFEEIGGFVAMTPESCRQVASRTRRRIKVGDRQPARLTEQRQRELITDLIGCILNGNISGVMNLLSPEVVQFDDGGPVRKAARRPIVGPHRVARFVVNIAKRIPPDAAVDFVNVNGTVGMMVKVAGVPDMVFSYEWTHDEKIRRMFVQLNPEKLRHLR